MNPILLQADSTKRLSSPQRKSWNDQHVVLKTKPEELAAASHKHRKLALLTDSVFSLFSGAGTLLLLEEEIVAASFTSPQS